MKRLFLLMLFLPAVSAICEIPYDGVAFDHSTVFCQNRYVLEQGIRLTADNIVVDCGNSILQGTFSSIGITMRDRKNITLYNCHLAEYTTGIYIRNSTNIQVIELDLRKNIIGLRLEQVTDSVFDDNYDISLFLPIKTSESKNNFFRFKNKRIGGYYCVWNTCNERTEAQFELKQDFESKDAREDLLRILKEGIIDSISV